MNSKKFALIIEGIVKDKRMSYMDAVLEYCKENDIDTASVGPLINKALKEKIKEEAEKLNILHLILTIFTSTMPKSIHHLIPFLKEMIDFSFINLRLNTIRKKC